MRKLLIISMVVACVAFAASCGGNENSDSNADKTTNTTPANDEKNDDVAKYDPNRGEGKFTKVELGASLDVTKAETGKRFLK